MSFWNGSRWVEEKTAPPATRPSRTANWAATIAMLIGLAVIIAPLGMIAAASHHSNNSGCAVNPSSADVGEAYDVSAWGSPTGTAVNIWVTDPNNATVGRPLGSTPDGTFNLKESSDSAGTWTYAFSGPTKKHMTLYGTCAVDAY
jgi:hypothetical protein